VREPGCDGAVERVAGAGGVDDAHAGRPPAPHAPAEQRDPAPLA